MSDPVASAVSAAFAWDRVNARPTAANATCAHPFGARYASTYVCISVAAFAAIVPMVSAAA